MRLPPDSEYRYAPIERLGDFVALGWMIVADLGPTHGEYSALAAWPCGCPPPLPVGIKKRPPEGGPLVANRGGG